LAPFRIAASVRGPEAPRLAPHLADGEDQRAGGLGIELEAFLLTPRMQRDRASPARLTATNASRSYWTFAQMAAHHASNGCNLGPGDLFGSGTLSGPEDASRACLAEINQRGAAAFPLPNGESRTWLEDGDEVIFRGRAQRPGAVPIGFGECRALVEPAPRWPGLG
jgi:fumarylacetoacetase